MCFGMNLIFISSTDSCVPTKHLCTWPRMRARFKLCLSSHIAYQSKQALCWSQRLCCFKWVLCLLLGNQTILPDCSHSHVEPLAEILLLSLCLLLPAPQSPPTGPCCFQFCQSFHPNMGHCVRSGEKQDNTVLKKREEWKKKQSIQIVQLVIRLLRQPYEQEV